MSDQPKIKLVRIFFLKANPFEAMNAMAVIHGVKYDAGDFSVPCTMQKFRGPSYEGYRAYFQHGQARELLEKVTANYGKCIEINYRGDEADIAVDTSDLLINAGVKNPHPV